MDRMGDDSRQDNKPMAVIVGDTIFALIAGVVGLFVLGAVVAVIWDIVNRI